MADLGHTASAARDLIPCMVGGAMPIPAAPNPEHGQMLVLWRLEAFFVVTSDDSESLASFRGLALAFPHHSNRTS